LNVRTVVMRSTPHASTFFVAIILLLNLGVSRGAVTLDALGLYLTKNGYGGAQLIRVGNFYHLPINSNGKSANLIIDTGSPATLIYRSSIKALGLPEERTKPQISTVFAQTPAFYCTPTTKPLTPCTSPPPNVPTT